MVAIVKVNLPPGVGAALPVAEIELTLLGCRALLAAEP